MNIMRTQKPGRVEYRNTERTTLIGKPAPPTPKPETAPQRHLKLSEYFELNAAGKKEHERRIAAARREGYLAAAGIDGSEELEDLEDIVNVHRQKILSAVEKEQGRLPELARTAILQGWTAEEYKKAKAELPPSPPANATAIGTAAPAKEPRESAKEGGYREGRQDLSALWEKEKKEEKADAGNTGSG